MAVGMAAILTYKFPTAADDAFIVQLGSDGIERLIFWDEAKMGRSIPTPAEIASWALPANKYDRRRAITRQADTEYEAVNAINGDVISMFKDELLMDIVANRLSPTANPLNASQTNRRNQMAAIRQSHRSKMTAIDAATTIAAVDAVTWP